MDVGREVILKVCGMLQGHLMDYTEDIDKAYNNADDALSISLNVKLQPDKDGIKISTQITFTTEKIKDGISVVFDPKQMQLFNDAHNETG